MYLVRVWIADGRTVDHRLEVADDNVDSQQVMQVRDICIEPGLRIRAEIDVTYKRESHGLTKVA